MSTVAGPSTAPGMVWVHVREDLDLATVDGARAGLAAVLDGTPAPGCVAVHVGVDRFVDLRGMRMLLQAVERARRRGGELVVVAPSTSVRLLAELLRCQDALPMAPTAEDAVRWWAGRR